MSTQWFGEQWGDGGPAAVCDDLERRVETPVGATCLWCGEPIEESDSGVVSPYIDAATNVHRSAHHVECYLRQGLGGVNHIEGRCTCCGGTEDPDPPDMTMREAAVAAVAAFERRHNAKVLPDKRETQTNVNPGGDSSGNGSSA